MRTALAFILLNGWLIAVGYAVLRAIGLSTIRISWAGPAFVAGVGVLVPIAILGLIAGAPLTVATILLLGAAIIAVSTALARRRAAAVAPAGDKLNMSSGSLSGRRRQGLLGVAAIAGLYVIYVAYAFAAAPSRGDDARIWSLRGLTLGYYHSLQPEIFLNQLQAGAHPQYPLLQPVLEAMLQIGSGQPQLRLYHTEIWVLVVAAVWSAIVLIARCAGPAQRRIWWLAVPVLLVLTPITTRNIYVGNADISGQMLMALAVLGLAIWLDTEDRACLAFAAIALAASASTKNEDTLAAGIVLVVSAGFVLWRHRTAVFAAKGGRGRFRPAWPLLAVILWFVVMIAPWRMWLAAHHLTDNVTPPFPHSLSPAYFVDRHRVNLVTAAMLQNTFQQWGWLAAIFLATCLACLIVGVKRQIAGFYLVTFFAIIAALIWLYTDTPLSLGFLIPTSMDRTVGVFMVIGALGSAHLLSALSARDE